MSKKVVWEEPKTSSKVAKGHYRSYKEFMMKNQAIVEEQQAANDYLAKAYEPMLALLKLRLSKGYPLIVMRPLRYQTSVLASELQEQEDSFYQVSDTEKEMRKARASQFVDTQKVIPPMTQLVLKAIDPNLQEFIFSDAQGTEHAVPFEARDALMTQTDIFEMVQKFLEQEGDK